MSFKQIVKNHHEIANCYQKGLQAMSNYSKKVRPHNPRNVNGSVFLEGCLKEKYKNESLWDYMVSYHSKIFFIEVHPASTANVSEMIKKVKWLRWWLEHKARDFCEMKADNPYRWVASNGVSISKSSKQAKQLAKNGITFPAKVTNLP